MRSRKGAAENGGQVRGGPDSAGGFIYSGGQTARSGSSVFSTALSGPNHVENALPAARPGKTAPTGIRARACVCACACVGFWVEYTSN